MLRPAAGMVSLRVMMRPMHDATLVIPDIFTLEGNPVPARKAVNTGRKIDVTRDQHGMAMAGIEQEMLVSAALVVIGRHFHDGAPGLYRYIMKPSGIGLGDAEGTAAVGYASGLSTAALIGPEDCGESVALCRPRAKSPSPNAAIRRHFFMLQSVSERLNT